MKGLVGTAVLAAFVFPGRERNNNRHVICCYGHDSIYNRLKIKRFILQNLIILQNCIMNLIPWGGPTCDVISL